ncbi:hypothetical protein [Curtobacterium sp. MCLR17_054]|uniref:YobI family P-loop NTPase n=1 Tax=Curtobacterium sp. MCLR17_054 TaxID=2175632 RepID=UPI0011B3C979|nr:hypothetical protein [Curtobacterium sp. MCLR17_054]WIE68571.1 hypothetical protein DEJ08_001020 [Curtobacterium sp. MCLR17_054]
MAQYGPNRPNDIADLEVTSSGRSDPARAPSLRALTPEYRPSAHESALLALLDQLNTDQDVRNIALTGPYGSGKSSVLLELQKRLGTRSINVSLSSLSTIDPALDEDADREGRPLPTTNFIQKEIVKQLLYRELPSDLPETRYSRTARRGNGPDISFGAAVGSTWLLVAGLLGLHVRIAQIFLAGNERAAWAGLLVMGFALGCAAYSVFGVLRRRTDLRTVSAGPASITLSNRDTYYFDEYLDELIYYFECNSVDVVIFEDLDRFDDTHILESLRNLNIILNNSKQVNRSVRFVYAIRDSIFTSKQASRGRRKAVDHSGSRTKFFDAIVPLVPFITYRTARDLLEPELADVEKKPNRAVIAAVAEHISDMRLLRNIVNEYRFFSADLLAPGHLEDLTPSALFAMVTYKNLAPADFELIRSGDSRLDEVFDQLAKLTTEKARVGDIRIAKLEDEMGSVNALEKGLANRVARLIERTDTVNSAIWSSASRASVQIDGIAVSIAEEKRAELVAAVLDAKSMDFGNFSLTKAQAEVLAGGSLSRSDAVDRANLEREHEIATLGRRRSFLSTATAGDLIKNSEQFETLLGKRSARQIVEALLGDYGDLWVKLLTSGEIDENFVLYTARYYGTSLSADGMTFLIRNVQRGIPDYDRPFSRPEDIDAILEQRGSAFLSEDSALNLSIANRLVETGDSRIKNMILRLAEPDAVALKFLSVFTRSDAAVSFWASLASEWPGALAFLAEEQGISASRAEVLLAATLEHGHSQTATEESRLLMRRYVGTLDLLHRDLDERVAARIVAQLADAEAWVEDLSLTSPRVRGAVVQAGAFVLSRANILDALETSSIPTIETIAESLPALYSRLTDDLPGFVSLRTPGDGAVADRGEGLSLMLRDAESSVNNATIRAIKASAPNVRVPILAHTPRTIWASLLAEDLVILTAANLVQYTADADSGEALDDAAVATVRSQRRFADLVPSGDGDLAVRILNTADLDAAERIELIDSMSDDVTVDASALGRSAGPTIGLLVAGGRLPDTLATATQAIRLGTAAVVSLAESSTAWSATLGSLQTRPDDAALIEIAHAETVPMENIRALAELIPLWDVRENNVARALLQRLADDADAIVTPEALSWLARNGRDTAPTISLLARICDSMDVNQIYAVTNYLGAAFAKLGSRERGWTLLPATDEVRVMLSRLQDVGDVSKVTPQDENLRVTITV